MDTIVIQATFMFVLFGPSLCEIMVIHKHMNTVFKGHIMMNISLPSWQVCAELCSKMPICKSVNYIAKEKDCQINYDAPDETKSCMTASVGNTFVGLSSLPKELTQSCVTNNCGEKDYCMRVPSKVECLPLLSSGPVIKDCSDLNSKEHKSGVYVIQLICLESFMVNCDMDTDGGDWTVFQKRYNGETNFSRGWIDYREGFRDPQSEFWLGNSKLALMTSHGQYELRIDLEDFQAATAYAKYSVFVIGNESTNYTLTINGYNGTADDSLKYHNNMAFSTQERDKDKCSCHCAVKYKSSWWYRSCLNAHLNGLYGDISTDSVIRWLTFRTSNSMKKASMMIRRKGT